MTNTEKVRNLFLTGKVKRATNAEIGTMTRITPHQQVFQITDRLVQEGFLKLDWLGRERIFSLREPTPSPRQPEMDLMGHSPERDVAAVSQLNKKKFLLDFGFELVGKWYLNQGNLDFMLSTSVKEHNILYAFLSGESLLYIGKSTQTVWARMNGYKMPGPTQITNINNHARIITLLTRGHSVEIYLFVDKELMTYKGIQINLSAGLEDNLILYLRPEWNGLGAKKL